VGLLENPLNLQWDRDYREQKLVIVRPKKGKWAEVPPDSDLPFVEDINRVIGASQIADAGSGKAMLKAGLKQMGWMYDRRATLGANLLVRRKYVVFDSSAKIDGEECYRLKLCNGVGGTLDYKLMKWIPDTRPERDFGGALIDFATSKKFLAPFFMFWVAVAIYFIVRSIG